MQVNIEWPGFRSKEIPLLEEDRELDSESLQPGDQAFEKLTSGLYLGDIARRILIKYVLFAKSCLQTECACCGNWEAM